MRASGVLSGRGLPALVVVVAAAVLPASVAGAVTASVAAAAPATTTGDVTVLLPTSTGAQARAATSAVATVAGARIVRRIPEIGVLTLRPTGSTSAATLASRLRATAGVQAAQTEHRMTLRASTVVPNDPALTDPENTPGTDAATVVQWPAWLLRLPEAWALSTGSGVRVGIIDSGIDGTHPDLRTKIATATNQSDAASARTDEQGHGTHVASLACAATGNGSGIAGAGDRCRIVFEKTDLGDSSVAASIVDAVKHGAKVISMSFGTDGKRTPPAVLTRAIAYAVKWDVVLVAAAADRPVDEQGDPANLLQPTGTGPVIASGSGLVVTAATVDGRRASFAGRGSQVSLAAYGTYRTSAGGPSGIFGDFPLTLTSLDTGTFSSHGGDPPCACRASFRGDSDYAYLSGTSMATPQVAGIAALVRSANTKLSAKQVIRILKSSARRSGGWSSDLGWGIVDAAAAVKLAKRTTGLRGAA
ncbi:MAG: hypothetical protein JWO02_2767 [Solirubrobacterales bacterium]|nr:hypothetical protein [Solirubrobacterales bacterium]